MTSVGVYETRPAVQLAFVQDFTGYLPGIAQPVSLFQVTVDQGRWSTVTLAEIDRVFRAVSPAYQPAVTAMDPLIARLLGSVGEVLRLADMPVFAEPQICGSQDDASSHRIAIPSLGLDGAPTIFALRWVTAVINRCAAGQSPKSLESSLQAVLEAIRRSSPRGMNTLRFLQAAHEGGVPWRAVGDNVFQFGWGSHARWLDSSFTDATSAIATRIARNKHFTAHVLRTAGIPVPAHALAADEVQALQIADSLGYPVVVKPLGEDGGRGVLVGIKEGAGVRRAYAHARKFSPHVLVEKHVEGNDYRLQVLNGEVYWGVHRVPGGVTGDGVRTIEALVASTNADPRRGPLGSKSLLKYLQLDDEASELLAEQRLNPGSIPPAGQFVRLRRAANVASGGVPVPVLEIAHPDNLALAIRAARVLRLDLAGIDLLIPDIARSWRETGAAICEVNAQPQLSPHLPALLLNRLVRGDGRIPVILILGNVGDAAWFQELLGSLEVEFRGLGIAQSDSLRVGKEIVGVGSFNLSKAGSALLSDPHVEALVLVADDERQVLSGLPVDRLDVLVLAAPCKGEESPDSSNRWRAHAERFAEVSAGLVVNQECSVWSGFATNKSITTVIACSPEMLQVAISDVYRKVAKVKQQD